VKFKLRCYVTDINLSPDASHGGERDWQYCTFLGMNSGTKGFRHATRQLDDIVLQLRELKIDFTKPSQAHFEMGGNVLPGGQSGSRRTLVRCTSWTRCEGFDSSTVFLLDIGHKGYYSREGVPCGVDLYVDNKPSLCCSCAATSYVILVVIRSDLVPQSAPLAHYLLTAFATCSGALLLLALLTY